MLRQKRRLAPTRPPRMLGVASSCPFCSPLAAMARLACRSADPYGVARFEEQLRGQGRDLFGPDLSPAHVQQRLVHRRAVDVPHGPILEGALGCWFVLVKRVAVVPRVPLEGGQEQVQPRPRAFHEWGEVTAGEDGHTLG